MVHDAVQITIEHENKLITFRCELKNYTKFQIALLPTERKYYPPSGLVQQLTFGTPREISRI